MRETSGERIFRVGIIAFLTLFICIPLYVMVTSAMKPLGDVQGNFTWIPSTITAQPFFDMWKTVPLADYFVNSIIVASLATLFSVIVAIFASYAVSRWRFRGRTVFTTTVLSTQMFPGVLFLLPLYILFVNIANATGITLVGTRLGLVITYLTFSLPFSIWMLAGYFDGIPRELDEASWVDGCTPLQTLYKVVLPAARPGVIAVAIYAFMTAWSSME